eukprot:scaffold36408_cov53-Attheya_sp.AAC.1
MTESSSLVSKTTIVIKTVYLIRHAESNENRRLASLTRSLKQLGRLTLPKKEDVAASVELLDVMAQVDSDVSPIGQKQIEQLGRRLEEDNFVKEKGIGLVVHSPLKRARQTAAGMLSCVSSKPAKGSSLEDHSHPGQKAESVQRVVELPCLAEKTPREWLPMNQYAFVKRIAQFETWLGEQPEGVIAVVGHSQYFKKMLGLSFKFGNCDVWELQFDPSLSLSEQSVVQNFASAESDTISDEKEEKDDDIKPPNDGNLEEVELPRGWHKMKSLYSYSDEM